MKTKTKKTILILFGSLIFGLGVGYGFGKLTKEQSNTDNKIELNKTQSHEQDN